MPKTARGRRVVALDAKVLSERIGHASTAITTDIYQHVSNEMQADAADRVGRLLFGGA